MKTERIAHYVKEMREYSDNRMSIHNGRALVELIEAEVIESKDDRRRDLFAAALLCGGCYDASEADQLWADTDAMLAARNSHAQGDSE